MLVAVAVAVAVALAGLAPGRAAASARGWLRPVDGAVLRAFSVVADRFAAGQHRGVDLAAPPGARVLAACGGRVSFAGRVPRGGRTVSVRCGSLIATYQHLGSVAVARGQAVMPAGGSGGRARATGATRSSRRARRGDGRVPRPAGPLRGRAVGRSRRCRLCGVRPRRPPRRGAAARSGSGAARRPVPVATGRRAPRAGPGPALGPAPAPVPVARGPVRAPAPVALGPRRRAASVRSRRQRARPRTGCLGRCGSGSRSSRSGCRSAAGSSRRATAGARPAAGRPAFSRVARERRGGARVQPIPPAAPPRVASAHG